MRTLFSYLAFSIAWLFVMDVLLFDRFNAHPHLQQFVLGSDVLFVATSALLLYLLLKLESNRRQRTEEQLVSVSLGARCLLFEADIQLPSADRREILSSIEELTPVGDSATRKAPLLWNVRVENVGNAQRVLPLEIPAGKESAEAAAYWHAWRQSRVAADADKARQIALQAVLDGRNGYSVEYRCVNKAGDLQWLHEDVTLQALGVNQWRAFGVCIDITERKRAEAEREEALRFAQATLDALPKNIAVLDETGVILTVNEAWRRFAVENGFADPQAGIGMNYLELSEGAAMPTGQQKQSDETSGGRQAALGIRAVIEGTQQEFAMEYPCHSPNEERWFLLRATRFCGAGPVRVVVAHENITPLKQSLLSLESSQLRFSRLFHFNPLPVLVVSMADWRILEVNDNWLALCGVTREEAIGRTPNELGVGVSSEVRQELREALAAGRLRDFECPFETRNNGVRTGLVAAEILDWEGEAAAFLAVHDITERKVGADRLLEKERQLELVETIGKIGYWECDVATRRKNWSGQVFHLMGHDSADGALSYDEVLQRYAPEDALRLHQCVLAAVHEKTRHSLDLRLQQPIGDSEYHLCHIQPITDDGGAVVKLNGIVQDVTVRRRAEEALRAAYGQMEERVRERTAELQERTVQLQERTAELELAKNEAEKSREEAEQSREVAERANAAKSEFLSRMSHELRTPLNAVIGFAQILELDADTPEQQEAVQHILHGGHHLLELINEVLDIARIEQGRMSLSLEAVNLEDVVGAALGLVRPMATARGVTLECVCGAQHWVMADLQRLRQVLLNLLSNAIKYNQSGGHVSVSTERVGQRLRLTVSDTGQGIGDAQMARLFVPFERLGAEHSSIEGMGLGLALSKRIVELMGGAIGVQSEPGRGSRFWIELNLAPDSIARSEGFFTEARIIDDAALSRTNDIKKVLYIEDNLTNLKLIERILEWLPEVQLVSAMQGSIGLQLARDHAPSLILLDLHLPDMDGLDLLEGLQTSSGTRDIPVMVISADALPARKEQAIAKGVVHFFSKPLDVRQFLEIMRSTLTSNN